MRFHTSIGVNTNPNLIFVLFSFYTFRYVTKTNLFIRNLPFAASALRDNTSSNNLFSNN